jgi:hypothetical protein
LADFAQTTPKTIKTILTIGENGKSSLTANFKGNINLDSQILNSTYDLSGDLNLSPDLLMDFPIINLVFKQYEAGSPGVYRLKILGQLETPELAPLLGTTPPPAMAIDHYPNEKK